MLLLTFSGTTEAYLKHFAVHKNYNNASRMTSKWQNSLDALKNQFRYLETSAGFLKSPNRTRIPKSGGDSWHLYRGYVGAGATVVVIASFPDEEWRQDGKFCHMWLSLRQWDGPKLGAVRFFAISVMEGCWRGKAYITDLHYGVWLLKDIQTVNMELVIGRIQWQRKLEEEMETENHDFTADEMNVAKEKPC